MKDDIDYMCQERKEEVDSLTFGIALMYHFKILRNIQKSKEWLIATGNKNNVTLRTNIKTKNLENRNGEKNKCKDTSSDKLGRLPTKWSGYDKEEETSWEKFNLF